MVPFLVEVCCGARATAARSLVGALRAPDQLVGEYATAVELRARVMYVRASEARMADGDWILEYNVFCDSGGLALEEEQYPVEATEEEEAIGFVAGAMPRVRHHPDEPSVRKAVFLDLNDGCRIVKIRNGNAIAYLPCDAEGRKVGLPVSALDQVRKRFPVRARAYPEREQQLRDALMKWRSHRSSDLDSLITLIEQDERALAAVIEGADKRVAAAEQSAASIHPAVAKLGIHVLGPDDRPKYRQRLGEVRRLLARARAARSW